MRVEYLFIIWICGCGANAPRFGQKVRPRDKTACEGSRMYLNCAEGQKLHILRATYGRIVLSVCNDRGIMTGWDLMCISSKSIDIVGKRCRGLQFCVLDVNNNIFFDPCPGTVKYLQVYYNCLSPEIAETNATSSSPTMSTVASNTQSTTTRGVQPVASTDAVIVKDNRIHCPATRSRGIEWPQTIVGSEAVAICPDDAHGRATWTCFEREHVASWKSSPDLSLCTTEITRDLETLVRNGISSEQVAQKVAQITRDGRMVGGDLIATSNFLHELVRSFRDEIASPFIRKRDKMVKSEDFGEALVESVDNMLGEKQKMSWTDISVHKRKTEVATILLRSLEQSADILANTLETAQSFKAETKHIIMEITVIEASPSTVVSDKVFPKLGSDRIFIPSQSLQSGAHDGRVKMIFTLYDNLAQYMSPNHHDKTETDESNMAVDGQEDNMKSITLVNSNIISASFMGARHPIDIPQPLRYTMRHDITDNVTNPRCAFWDYRNLTNTEFIGSWSTAGCRLIESNSTHTQCECDHMTNFAVLMDVVGTEMRTEHVITLQVFTYAGCFVSIVCLFLCFITFTCFRNLKNDRNTIHKNLVICLLLAEVLFLTGIGQADHQILCPIMAGLLHFLFLCAHSWMFLEGVQLYVMLIEVFEAEKSRVKFYYLSGYGAPVIIVAMSAAIFPRGYGTSTHCWLSTERGFIWAFVGPVVLVISVNMVMLSIAIYIMWKHANSNAGFQARSRLCGIRVWIKSSFVLVVLLGLTWAFGVMYVNSETLVMAYIFTILNVLQGLFIFIFHCLMNDKVHKEWKKCARRTRWLPECIRVGYGEGNVHVSTSPSRTSSSAGNYFSRLLSGRRNKKRSSLTSLPKPMVFKNNNANDDLSHDSGQGSSVFHASEGSGKCDYIASIMNDRLQGGKQNSTATTCYRTPVSLYLPSCTTKTEILKQRQNGYDSLVPNVPSHHFDVSGDDICHSEFSDADLFKMTDYCDESRMKHVDRVEEMDEGYDGYEVPVPTGSECYYEIPGSQDETIYHVLIPEAKIPDQLITKDSGMLSDITYISRRSVIQNAPSIPELSRTRKYPNESDPHQSEAKSFSSYTTPWHSESDIVPNEDILYKKSRGAQCMKSLPNLTFTNAFQNVVTIPTVRFGSWQETQD